MERTDPALGLLGLAARAGRVVAGTERVREAARGTQLKYAILADDASAGRRAKVQPLLEARGLPWTVRYETRTLGAAIGRGPVSAVGITDAAFAGRLRALLEAAAPASDAVAARGATR
jgi:ribosomal protein L7Ae-like RNA K-turn-binding protein